MVAIAFFCTWVVPSVLAEEAGDKMAEIFKKEIKPVKDLIPDGVKIAKTFKSGKGDPIGKVNAIKGKGLVVHKFGTEAYPLKKGVDLFMGDMIVTDGGASVQAALNDKSAVSIAGYTKLVLDKSVYDLKSAKRDSVLSLLFGKARFIVSKVAEGKEDYFVKTPTAITGVRGSDFALSVVPTDKIAAVDQTWWQWLSSLFLARPAYAAPQESPLVTTVATGKETTISFTGDTGPTQVVGPNMISQAIAGVAATVPLALTAAVVLSALGGAGAGAGMAAATTTVSTAAIVGAGVAVAAVGAGVAASGGSSGGSSEAHHSDASSSSSTSTPQPTTLPCGEYAGTYALSYSGTECDGSSDAGSLECQVFDDCRARWFDDEDSVTTTLNMSGNSFTTTLPVDSQFIIDECGEVFISGYFSGNQMSGSYNLQQGGRGTYGGSR